jgi:tetratricopeptide (TPR) repeat protein
MGDLPRPIWDFDDLEGTEGRFRELLAGERSDATRAEILTQLARIEGLRGNIDEGRRLIDRARAIAGDDVLARARIDLELGRLHRSSGSPDEAFPLFGSAFALAEGSGEGSLAADAAHMAALAAPDAPGMLEWTRRGMDAVERSGDPSDTYWLGPLLNNLGWHHHDAGEYEEALAAFERALEVRERDPGRPGEIEIARYAVAKTLRALGRADEAAALMEKAIAWTREVGQPDGWFHEELAEDYAALGRDDDAGEQAKVALAVFGGIDPSLVDATQLERLRALAREGSGHNTGRMGTR